MKGSGAANGGNFSEGGIRPKSGLVSEYVRTVKTARVRRRCEVLQHAVRFAMRCRDLHPRQSLLVE